MRDLSDKDPGSMVLILRGSRRGVWIKVDWNESNWKYFKYSWINIFTGDVAHFSQLQQS